jgi:LacI family transcriptional regulator
MRDVAALAGVSIGTVSNVLNNPDVVSPATCEKVTAAIEKLGWVRNESARQLRAGRSNAVGIIVMDVQNPFFTDLIRGAEKYCYDHGLSVYIGNSDQIPEREASLLDRFESSRVRGVVLAPIAPQTDAAERLRRLGIPVVLVDRANNAGFCTVGMDDIEGGRVAVKHLLDLGHRRIAYVGGPSTLSQVANRRRGAEIALDSVPDAEPLLTVSTPTLDIASGVTAAQELAALPDVERPTAVFGANDMVAIGMLQGFFSCGLRVPEDVNIIGYDDIEFAAAAAVPLSSIRQPRHGIGRTGAQLLVEEIDAADGKCEHTHQTVLLSPELVSRRSTSAVA